MVDGSLIWVYLGGLVGMAGGIEVVGHIGCELNGISSIGKPNSAIRLIEFFSDYM